MERITLFTDKAVQVEDHFWERESYFVASFSLHLILGICFIIGMTPMLFVDRVLAHSDVDPEIMEISAQLADQPGNVTLLLKRGQLYRFNGKFSDSLRDLEQAWKLNPDNRNVALERCRTLVALGFESEAEEALDQYLQGEVGGSRVTAVVERAYLYERTGRPKLAIADFSEALQHYPTIELYLARGHLQEKLGLFDVAVAGYQEGLNRLQQASILRRELIRIKIAQGHYPETLPLIDEELSLAPVKTEWYLRRADVLAAMGQTEATEAARTHALDEANRVLAKRPTAIHRVARAKVYQSLGRIEAAKQDLRLAIQSAPRFAEARDLLNKLEVQ